MRPFFCSTISHYEGHSHSKWETLVSLLYKCGGCLCVYLTEKWKFIGNNTLTRCIVFLKPVKHVCMEKNTLGSSKYNYFNIIEFLILGGCLIKRFIFSLWQSLCNLRRKQRCVAAWLHHLSNCVIFIQKGHASVNDILLGSEVLDLRS